MAAREKKTPIGNGTANKKLSNAASPVPVRESIPQNTAPAEQLSVETSSDVKSQQNTDDNQSTPVESNQETSKKVENVAVMKKVTKKEELTENAVSNVEIGPTNAANKTTRRRRKKIRFVPKRTRRGHCQLKTDLKAKNKLTARRGNISKNLVAAAKLSLIQSPEQKAALIKNGIRKPRVRKPKIKTETTEIVNDNAQTETGPAPEIIQKKRIRKKKVLDGEIIPNLIPKTEIKTEPICEELPDIKPNIYSVPEISATTIKTEIPSPTTPKKVRHVVLKKKLVSPAKVIKKRTIRKKAPDTIIEKQKIVESIAKDTKLDLDAQNVINQLDLTVPAKVAKTIRPKRRHSIEKLAHLSEKDRPSSLPGDLSQFDILPRSGSPRAKRNSKIRQTIDIAIPQINSKPLNSTRSDIPARILRNGKHRKLKDLQLLEAANSIHRKRRRIHSESRDGSEKNLGYQSESESSYCESTLSNLENGVSDIQMEHSMETIEPVKTEAISIETVSEEPNTTELTKTQARSRSNSMDSGNISKEIKLELINDADNENNNTDEKLQPNSSLIQNDTKPETEDVSEDALEKASNSNETETDENVPEKLLILNQMAQNFNEVGDNDPNWKGRRTTRASWRKSVKGSSDDNTSISEQQILEEGVPAKSFYGPGDSENEKTAVALTFDEKSNQSDNIGDNKLEFSSKTDVIINEIASTDLKEEEPSESKIVVNQLSVEENKIKVSINDENSASITEIPKRKSVDEIPIDTKLIFDVTRSVMDQVTITARKRKKSRELQIDESVLEKIQNDDVKKTVLKTLDLNTVSIELRPVSSATDPSKNSGIKPVEKPTTNIIIEETPENQVIKEKILSALGLQSLAAAAEAKLTKTKINKSDIYTGTLKTVIKINRSPDKKKGRLKMTLQKSKARSSFPNGEGLEGNGSSPDGDNCYKVMKEADTWNSLGQSSDTAGANRKSHYPSNRSNTDGSSEHMSDEGTAADGDDTGANGTGKAKTLVIPEKASSFSIHPERLCRDNCCYCFGKFGLFDTPCHIAQLKSVERQKRILEIEKHLLAESCLCDACFRHIDRKANSKTYKRSTESTVPVGPRICHVQNCEEKGTHIIRRKWVLKMKRNLHQHVQFDLEPPNPNSLHSILVCPAHHEALEKLMACAMCKRRRPRNDAHMFNYEDAELLNKAFAEHNLPIRLATSDSNTSQDGNEPTGNVVCKLCRYFATLLLKPPDKTRVHPIQFLESYGKRLLQLNNVEVGEDAEIDVEDIKDKEKPPMKRTRKARPKKVEGLNNKTSTTSENADKQKHDSVQTRVSIDFTTKDSRVPSNDLPELDNSQKSRSNSPSSYHKNSNSVDNSDSETSTRKPDGRKASLLRYLPKDSKYVVELHKIPKEKKTNNASNTAVERLETNPSISVRQLFPGEDDLPLHGQIDFATVKERTPEGWEKSSMTVQYDYDTKRLWNELQKPYGNHSSFLRHLILLEKYFRNGDLVLTPNASHHATNYCESVQNRLRAYDNLPSQGVNLQPLAMIPFNTQVRKPTISQSGIVTGSNKASLSKNTKSTPNTPNNVFSLTLLQPNVTNSGGFLQIVPPTSTSTPTATNTSSSTPAPRVHSNKKTTVAKTWRPSLVSVPPNKTSATVTSGALTKQVDAAELNKQFSGIIQVTSGGKSFHMTVQDYNRMCALRRENEIRALKKSEAKASTSVNTTPVVSVSTVSVLKQRPTPSTSSTTTSNQNTNANTISFSNDNSKSILEQLQIKQSLEQITGVIPTEPTTTNSNSESHQKKPVMILPKIPKSLTVIPQTVRRSTESQNPNLSVVSLNKTTS